MFTNVLENLRRLEMQMDRQTIESARNLVAQNEERTAHLAALAELQRPLPPQPQQIFLAVPRPRPAPNPPPCAAPALPPPPPPSTLAGEPPAMVPVPAAAPAVASVSPPPSLPLAPSAPVSKAEAQVQTAVTKPAQHDRAARFAEYLLHGPPGEVRRAEGLTSPRFSWPPLQLQRPKVHQMAPKCPIFSSSGSTTQELSSSSSGIGSGLSPGELRSLGGPGWGSPGEVQSPGELQQGRIPESPGETIEPSEPGEIASAGAAEDPRWVVAAHVPLLPTERAEPGEVPSPGTPVSAGEASEGEAGSFGEASPEDFAVSN